MRDARHFDVAEIDTGDGMIQEAFTVFGKETAHMEIALQVSPEERKQITGLPDTNSNIWLQLFEDGTAFLAVPGSMEQTAPHTVSLNEADALWFRKFAQEHVYGYDGMMAKIYAFGLPLPLQMIRPPTGVSEETGKQIWINSENYDEPANIEFLLTLPEEYLPAFLARADALALGKMYELHGTCTAEDHLSLILQHHSEFGVFKHIVPLKKSEEEQLLPFVKHEIKGFQELQDVLKEQSKLKHLPFKQKPIKAKKPEEYTR